jgi:hypothetical protein
MFLSTLSSTVHLCWLIRQQLSEAKHNRLECQSLHTVVAKLQGYLEQLNVKTLSAKGQEALGEAHQGSTKGLQGMNAEVTCTRYRSYKKLAPAAR